MSQAQRIAALEKDKEALEAEKQRLLEQKKQSDKELRRYKLELASVHNKWRAPYLANEVRTRPRPRACAVAATPLPSPALFSPLSCP